MWDDSFRWEFGAHVPVADEEAARPLLEVATTPRTDEEPPLLLFDHEVGDRNLVDADDDPFVGIYDNLHATLSHHFSAQAIPRSSTRSLVSSQHDMKHFLQTVKRKAGVGGSDVSNNHFATLGSTDGHQDHKDHDELNMRPEPTVEAFKPDFVQPDFDEPFLTLSDKDGINMESIFTPVRGQLQRLKGTAPESLPRYNPHVKANSHAQVLKKRLEGIGEHIQRVLDTPAAKDMTAHGRGMLELKLCRFISTNYWPLPTTPTTHLDIQRIYRNALFRSSSRARLEEEQKRHREWVSEVDRSTRMSFGEAAARHVSSLQIAHAIEDIAPLKQDDVAYAKALQESIDHELAEELENENQDQKWDEIPALVSANHNSPIEWEDNHHEIARAIAASLDPDNEMPDLPQIVSNNWQKVDADNNDMDTSAEPTWQTADEQLRRDAAFTQQHLNGGNTSPSTSTAPAQRNPPLKMPRPDSESTPPR